MTGLPNVFGKTLAISSTRARTDLKARRPKCRPTSRRNKDGKSRVFPNTLHVGRPGGLPHIDDAAGCSTILRSDPSIVVSDRCQAVIQSVKCKSHVKLLLGLRAASAGQDFGHLAKR